MTTLTMDTHKVVKRLRDAGFTDQQAETVTDVLRESREADLAGLATKADLALLGSELRAELAQVRTELGGLAAKADLVQVRTELGGLAAKADLADVKADLLKWIVTLMLGQAAVIGAMVKLF